LRGLSFFGREGFTDVSWVQIFLVVCQSFRGGSVCRFLGGVFLGVRCVTERGGGSKIFSSIYFSAK
jgi:hypothetical protein